MVFYILDLIIYLHNVLAYTAGVEPGFGNRVSKMVLLPILCNCSVLHSYLFYSKFRIFRVSKIRIGCPNDRWTGLWLNPCFTEVLPDRKVWKPGQNKVFSENQGAFFFYKKSVTVWELSFKMLIIVKLKNVMIFIWKILQLSFYTPGKTCCKVQ